jgi:hypothetical protein
VNSNVINIPHKESVLEYNELVELWKKQREQYQLWEVRLTFSTEELRKKMQAKIGRK